MIDGFSPSKLQGEIMRRIPELVCPAGNLPALKTAVDNGADTVYMGLKDATNARNFPGLNFDMKSAQEGVAYAHARGRNVLMAINTFAQAGQIERWHRAVDTAVQLGADAIIVADPAIMAYAAERHPNLRLHMSVQGSATNYEAINMMKELFGIRRAVLPRVLTVDQVKHVIDNTDVEIEVFGFGSLCVMVEGRCILSSYATGESPNMQGVCSPAKAVRWEQLPDRMNVRLNQVLIDQYKPNEPAGYPTLCKGRFEVNDETYYALEEPTSLNVLEMLPELIKIGVSAIKIEGRQRSPMYTAQATKSLRQALDAAAAKAALQAGAGAHPIATVNDGHQASPGSFQGGIQPAIRASAPVIVPVAGHDPDPPIPGGQAGGHLLTGAQRIGSRPDDDQDLQVPEGLVEYGADGPFQVRTGTRSPDDDAESGPVHAAHSRTDETSQTPAAHVLLPCQLGSSGAPEPRGVDDAAPLEQVRIEVGELLVGNQHCHDISLLNGLPPPGQPHVVPPRQRRRELLGVRLGHQDPGMGRSGGHLLSDRKRRRLAQVIDIGLEGQAHLPYRAITMLGDDELPYAT